MVMYYKQTNMSKGIALTIGMNKVSKDAYGGWEGPLSCCENDSNLMTELLNGQGYETTELLTSEATRASVVEQIGKAAEALVSGDIFVLYYSGHGGQLRDLDFDEWDDCLDETWCLYDGQLLDDELYQMWTLFAEDVRILVISDSCHSGTVIKEMHYESQLAETKIMPFDVSEFVYAENKGFYDDLMAEKKKRYEIETSIKSSILLLSACQDNQTARAGHRVSFYTSRLLKAWKEGQFVGDYRSFHGAILKQMPRTQSPNYVCIGKANKEFERELPFTI